MKIKLMMSALAALAIAISSCGSEDAKLAGQLNGTWKGEPTAMMKGKMDKDSRHQDGRPDKTDRGEMTCTPTLTFVRTEGTNGGTLNVSADYTIAQGVESANVTTPVSATVNGNLSASGSWVVEDGDEVRITLDPSKTIVNVDTASMSLSYAKITDAPQDSLISLKEKIAANIADVIKPMLASRVQKMRKFDDVKVKGNNMVLEAGHNKISFTKQ